MKKVLLLMAGVLLISGAAMADNLKNDEVETVDVTVVVEQYADLEVAGSSVAFDNLTQPGASSTKTIGYRVESNCPVTLTATGVEFAGVSEEILSLDATVANGEVVENPEEGINYGVGAKDETLSLTAALTDREDSANGDNWYDLAAGEKTGTITLTVAAAE